MRTSVSKSTHDDLAQRVQRHLTPERGVGKKKLKELTAEALDDLHLRTCELTLIEVGVAVRAGYHDLHGEKTLDYYLDNPTP